MNVRQMLKHCLENEWLLQRKKVFKDVLIGRLFGPMALKSDTKNDKPFSKNSPTHPDLKFGAVNENIDVLKEEWLHLLKDYPNLDSQHYLGFKHPFFRRMSYHQVGVWAFKHVDHHLRQFGV
ncbi:MAG: DinB family protein [Bacteroidota bacterium]